MKKSIKTTGEDMRPEKERHGTIVADGKDNTVEQPEIIDNRKPEEKRKKASALVAAEMGDDAVGRTKP